MKVSPQRVSASPQGNALSHPAYRTCVKDLLSSLRMIFQVVFCSCHILFPTLISTVKEPADFICHNLFIFFFFQKVFALGIKSCFFPLPIKYVCLRVAEVIIGHSEELCKLFTCLVTWSCRFSLLAGQIGNSLKSLLGLFWLWSSMMLWIILFYAFLHLYDLYDKHLAVNYLLHFFDECRKTSRSLQFFLGLFFM